MVANSFAIGHVSLHIPKRLISAIRKENVPLASIARWWPIQKNLFFLLAGRRPACVFVARMIGQSNRDTVRASRSRCACKHVSRKLIDWS